MADIKQDIYWDQTTFDCLSREVSLAHELIQKEQDTKIELVDKDSIIKRLTSINKEVKAMHKNIYRYEMDNQQNISGQLITINSEILHILKIIKVIQDKYDKEARNMILSQKI